MTTPKKPTNSDIFRAINGIQSDIGGLKTDVKSIHEQVKKTNGRVTQLETTEAKRTAIEDYIEKEGKQVTPQETSTWSNREKTFITIIMVLLAIVAALTGAKVIGV